MDSMFPASGKAKKRFVSLSARLALSTVALLALVSTVVFIELARREREGLVASKVKAASMVVELAASSLVAPLDFGDAKDVQSSLDYLKSNREISFAAVFGAEGKEALATLGPLPQGGVAAPSDAHVLKGENSIELTRKIVRPDGSSLGALLVVFSLEAENNDFRARSVGILGATATSSFAVAVLLVLITRLQIIRPLDRLVAAAQRLARGEQRVRVAIAREDEIGRLAGAFNGMSAAIVDREQRLALATSRLREVLDHMRQAIIVFGKDGEVDELRSNAASQLFGKDAAGKHIRELLYGNSGGYDAEAQLFDAWLEYAFVIPESDWKEYAETAPQEITLKGENGASLELEFRPILSEGETARVMLIATDVTERKRLLAEVESQQARHEGQLAAMRRLVAGSGQAFAGFLQETDRRLAECHQLLQPKELDPAALGRVLELVHTTRGEARAYNLPDVAEECGAVESALAPLRESETAAKRWAVLQADVLGLIEKSGQGVDAARELFVKASPIGRAILDQATVRKSDLEKLQRLVENRRDSVERLVANLASVPFGQCAAAVERAGVRWAEGEEKPVTIAIEGRDVQVPPKLARILGGVLAHLVRNCIAHGIEPASQRLAAGKKEIGEIELSASALDDSCTIVVRDDGGGVNESAVREKARGTAYENASVEDMLFAPGITTTHTKNELSGLGVGLSAVREELLSVGYTIHAEWTPGRGTTFTLSAGSESPPCYSR